MFTRWRKTLRLSLVKTACAYSRKRFRLWHVGSGATPLSFRYIYAHCGRTMHGTKR
jgi:hypothetical protein